MLKACLTGATLLFSAQAHGGHSGHECGTESPTEAQMERARANERAFMGKAGSDLTSSELSSIAAARANGGFAYHLVDMPLVYHVLENSDNGGTGSPAEVTNAQLEYATAQTNKLYTVFNDGFDVPWATFVTDEIIRDGTAYNDCNGLSSAQLNSIVQQATNWQYKLHVIVCETTSWSGVAWYPGTWAITDPKHNLVRVEWRALASITDDGIDLNPGATKFTRWWRTRSTVVAHEFGHAFGLPHTFNGGCTGGDGVADTPAQTDSSTNGCPGLLPYDKNRDLFDTATASDLNQASGDCVYNLAESNTVLSPCAGNTCQACCSGQDNNGECSLYNGLDSIPFTGVVQPECCDLEIQGAVPDDSCPNQAGIDPNNNVMAYVPDFCSHEFTPGQVLRMMSEFKAEKDIMYCNYADVVDAAKCAGVPCGPDATSPNCVESCVTDGDCTGGSVCNPRGCVSSLCADKAGPCTGTDICTETPACGLASCSCSNELDCEKSAGCSWAADGSLPACALTGCGDCSNQADCDAASCSWSNRKGGQCVGSPTVSGSCSGTNGGAEYTCSAAPTCTDTCTESSSDCCPGKSAVLSKGKPPKTCTCE